MSHLPWGENARPQHGAGAFVGDPEPTDALARLEADLFGGIDLPDVVGLARPRRGRGRPTARGSGTEASLLEPALQGAFAGEGLVGMAVLQDDAEEAGAPGAVQLPQRHEFVVEGLLPASDAVE